MDLTEEYTYVYMKEKLNKLKRERNDKLKL